MPPLRDWCAVVVVGAVLVLVHLLDTGELQGWLREWPAVRRARVAAARARRRTAR